MDPHIGAAVEAGTLGNSVGVWAGLEETSFPHEEGGDQLPPSLRRRRAAVLCLRLRARALGADRAAWSQKR